MKIIHSVIPALAGMTGLIFSSLVLAKTFDPPLSLVVKSEVADIRSKPVPHTGGYAYDPLQETQVEKGDPVVVYERSGKWARVEAPYQMEYTHENNWQGYPGWILWSALTRDLAQLRDLVPLKIPEDELRSKILEKAELHVGNAYLWGGRSLFNPKIKSVVTGVDCSGLVNWSFRQCGIAIPRDAHEQFMRARPIEPKNLNPADLIFLAKTDDPKKVVHVAFFVKGEELLEAPQTGEKVRKITFKDRFGRTKDEIKSGDAVGGRIVYFGTLFGVGL